LVCTLSLLAAAEPIKVRHPEGTLHGFLALTTEQGQVLAIGKKNKGKSNKKKYKKNEKK